MENWSPKMNGEGEALLKPLPIIMGTFWKGARGTTVRQGVTAQFHSFLQLEKGGDPKKGQKKEGILGWKFVSEKPDWTKTKIS